MQTSLISKRKQNQPNKQNNSSYRIHLYVFRSSTEQPETKREFDV